VYQTLSENAWCGGRVVSFLRKTAWTFWYGGFYYELIRWEKDTRLAQEEQGDAAASSASAGGAGGAGGAAGAGGEREKRRLSSEVVESEENAVRIYTYGSLLSIPEVIPAAHPLVLTSAGR